MAQHHKSILLRVDAGHGFLVFHFGTGCRLESSACLLYTSIVTVADAYLQAMGSVYNADALKIFIDQVQQYDCLLYTSRCV